MNVKNISILLADDDDCMFFKQTLAELSHSAILTTVNDRVQLIDYLSDFKFMGYYKYAL